jgi:hypothetical protein
MTVSIDFALVASLLAGAVSIVGLIGFGFERKRAFMEDGKRNGEIQQLRKDADDAHSKIRSLETAVHCTELDVAGMRQDIQHILLALTRIEDKLDGK